MGRRRAAAGGRTKKRVEVLEKEGGFGGFYLLDVLILCLFYI